MSAARRGGFTLVEQVVVLVVLVIIGAATAPFIIGAVDRARVEEAADALAGIVDGTTAFYGDVRTTTAIFPYPGSLSQLTTPITASDPATLDICGDQYTANHASAWRGPYIDRAVGAGGVNVAIGTAQDALVLVTSNGATLLAIEVPGVTIEDAGALNEIRDGDEGANASTAGTVRWGATDADGRVTLQYLRPVSEC
jgi:type II secretory pathway pseudopilin PulG